MQAAQAFSIGRKRKGSGFRVASCVGIRGAGICQVGWEWVGIFAGKKMEKGMEKGILNKEVGASVGNKGRGA